MLTHPKSTLHILHVLMHLSSGHVTLWPVEFHPSEFLHQSDRLTVPGGLTLGFAPNLADSDTAAV